MQAPCDPTGPVVRDRPERSRFELLDGDEVVGIADYSVHGDVAIMPHTVIDPSRRGEGLGDVLVAGAVAELDRRGLRVDPACWFVADHLRRYPLRRRRTRGSAIDGGE